MRLGVTGHRRLPDDPALAASVREVISRVREQAVPDRPLVVLSPLAEGADRLVAREVLAVKGATLEAVLPLPRDDYERDFESPESMAQFRALLNRASKVTVLSPAPMRDEAYEQAGRWVVDHCDVLIALWDGKPSRGRGGTAEIVEYAKQRGVLVYWIRTDPPFLVTVLEVVRKCVVARQERLKDVDAELDGERRQEACLKKGRVELALLDEMKRRRAARNHEGD